jgi:hypothetical protein
VIQLLKDGDSVPSIRLSLGCELMEQPIKYRKTTVKAYSRMDRDNAADSKIAVIAGEGEITVLLGPICFPLASPSRRTRSGSQGRHPVSFQRGQNSYCALYAEASADTNENKPNMIIIAADNTGYTDLRKDVKRDVTVPDWPD